MNRLTRDSVSRHVDADPAVVWDLVSDVTRTPEYSRQVVDVVWLDGVAGPQVGARFRARNRQRWFTWSNRPVVTVAEPGRAFAFSRTERGGGTMQWRWDVEASDGGSEVTLSYEVLDPVPVGLHMVLKLLLGVPDLEADLNENMRQSLDRIAAIAERATTSGA